MRSWMVPLLAAFISAATGQEGQRPDEDRFRHEPSQCFDLSMLEENDRRAADELFLKILDSEALYTVVGGLKPISSGFVRFTVDADAPNLEGVDSARRLLHYFRCGDLVYATVYHFRKTYENSKTGKKQRYYDGVAIARQALKRIVKEYEAEFARLGVSPHSDPMEVVLAVEHSEELARWRGYGRLFGFPSFAVEFFVDAGRRQMETGEFVKRRFISFPTFTREERGFVYAVAEDHEEEESERRLRASVNAVLAEYRQRRKKYIGDTRQGAAQLLRDWFCPDGRRCALPLVHGSSTGAGQ